MENHSLNAGLIFALGTDFVRIRKRKPYVLGQMRMQRLSGRKLSFLFYAYHAGAQSLRIRNHTACKGLTAQPCAQN